jgi:hypothetical protein
MKIYLAAFLVLLCFSSRAQQDTGSVPQPTYKRHTILATVSLGFVDPYRQYTVPAGFEKNNSSGYALVYGKLEYGFTSHISLAATFVYDALYLNNSQLYTGFSGPIKRPQRDALRIVGGGVTAFYHLSSVIHVKHLDPFVGVGISLNNIRHSNYPQGDSTLIKLDHVVTPYLKAGARYYLSSRCSLFGDVGYDNQSIFSLGFSCRFLPRTQKSN